MFDDNDPDKIVKRKMKEVADQLKRYEDAIQETEKRAREAERKYDAGNRWPDE